MTEEDIKNLQSTGGDHLAATQHNILANDMPAIWELVSSPHFGGGKKKGGRIDIVLDNAGEWEEGFVPARCSLRSRWDKEGDETTQLTFPPSPPVGLPPHRVRIVLRHVLRRLSRRQWVGFRGSLPCESAPLLLLSGNGLIHSRCRRIGESEPLVRLGRHGARLLLARQPDDP